MADQVLTMVGDIQSTNTILTIMSKNEVVIYLQIVGKLYCTDTDEYIEDILIEGTTHVNGVKTIRIDKLCPSSNYTMRLSDYMANHQTGEMHIKPIATHHFTTSPPEKIIFVSGDFDKMDTKNSLWKNISAEKPNLVVHMGNNLYGDSTFEECKRFTTHDLMNRKGLYAYEDRYRECWSRWVPLLTDSSHVFLIGDHDVVEGSHSNSFRPKSKPRIINILGKAAYDEHAAVNQGGVELQKWGRYPYFQDGQMHESELGIRWKKINDHTVMITVPTYYNGGRSFDQHILEVLDAVMECEGENQHDINEDIVWKGTVTPTCGSRSGSQLSSPSRSSSASPSMGCSTSTSTSTSPRSQNQSGENTTNSSLSSSVSSSANISRRESNAVGPSCLPVDASDLLNSLEKLNTSSLYRKVCVDEQEDNDSLIVSESSSPTDPDTLVSVPTSTSINIRESQSIDLEESTDSYGEYAQPSSNTEPDHYGSTNREGYIDNLYSYSGPPGGDDDPAWSSPLVRRSISEGVVLDILQQPDQYLSTEEGVTLIECFPHERKIRKLILVFNTAPIPRLKGINLRAYESLRNTDTLWQNNDVYTLYDKIFQHIRARDNELKVVLVGGDINIGVEMKVSKEDMSFDVFVSSPVSNQPLPIETLYAKGLNSLNSLKDIQITARAKAMRNYLSLDVPTMKGTLVYSSLKTPASYMRAFSSLLQMKTG